MCVLFPTWQQGSRRKILLVFSWYTNGKLLLNTKRSANTFPCLHGIRFLSITWVVMGHVYITAFSYPGANMLYLLDYVSNACLFIFKNNKK